MGWQTKCVQALTVGLLTAFALSARAEPEKHAVVNAHDAFVGHESISVLGPWGTAKNVVFVDEMYFSGQPDADGFARAAAQGVTTVINIRGADEVDWDVAGTARAAGLTYYNEPLIISRKGLDEASIERINSLVRQLGSERVLVHCASGNRVAAWWATHLASQHGLEAGVAIDLARSAGMTKPELVKMVQKQLK